MSPKLTIHRRSSRHNGKHLSKIDIEAIRCRWKGLPLNEKLAALRFNDLLLTSKIYSTWEKLRTTDLASVILGLGSLGPKADEVITAIEQFGIEGIIGEDGQLETVFYAKPSFLELNDVFDLIETWLGSPFMDGRCPLASEDWPALVQFSPNSWSEFMSQILKIIEQAIVKSSLIPAHQSDGVHEGASQSRSAKRRQRKQRNEKVRRLELQTSADIVSVLPEDVCAICASTKKEI